MGVSSHSLPVPRGHPVQEQPGIPNLLGSSCGRRGQGGSHHPGHETTAQHVPALENTLTAVLHVQCILEERE